MGGFCFHGMSYVITGNPGVGKHTISENISKVLGCKILDINKIAKESGLFQKNDDTNDVDIDELSKVIEKKISKSTLIVGHLAPYVISPERIKKAIVLRKNPHHLISVYKKRGYSKTKIKDNLGSEVLGIIFYDVLKKFGKEKTLQIDVTLKTIEDTTKKILGMINEEIKAEEIDWIPIISNEDDLQEFFSY